MVICPLKKFAGTSACDVGISGDGFGDRPKTWWTYFTNWTFVLFAIWSVLGIYVTAVYVQVSL